jgi:hypothetical protein
MKISKKVFALLLAVPLGLVGSASAADFTPEMSFTLAPAKIKANPELGIHLEQDAAEEELGHVTLAIPKGFKLPADAAIDNGAQIGSADLEIGAGPGCAAAGPPVAPAMFPDRSIVEKDRTDEQADRGVKAVWVVDLQPVTTIPLEVTGSPKKGWKLDGDIPANQFTCPPLVFDATIFSETADAGAPPAGGGVKIVTNPKLPGKYVFSGTFSSQDSPTKVTIKQPVKITR